MYNKLLSRLIIYKLIIIFIIIFFNFIIQNIVFADILRPLAVMIGNSPEEIIYQSGLNKADIVYEINVEYPFTRLMAIYINSDSTIVGPIRSSRFYFSRLAAEWQSVFAHCGGQSLKDERMINLDEMYYSSPYWRDKNIGGWINLFSDTKNLREKSRKLGHLEKIQLADNIYALSTLNLSGGNISKITIKYSQKYSVYYEYVRDNNSYTRYINSKLHQDSKTLENISVSNIIVQYAPIEKIEGDKQGKMEVNIIGEGIAKVFYGGQYFLAKWIKKSKEQPTLYYDAYGNLLKLNKGKTWIQVVSNDTNVWIK